MIIYFWTESFIIFRTAYIAFTVLNTILSVVAPVRSRPLSLGTFCSNQLTSFAFSWLSGRHFRGKQMKILTPNPCFYIHQPASHHMLISPQLALHSIFCSRVIFIILSQQKNRDDANPDTPVQYSTGGIILSSILDTYATPYETLPPHPRAESQYSGDPAWIRVL